MYQHINTYSFIDAFIACGRYDHKDGQGGNFTYEALVALFDYLEDLEDDLGEEMQLDPIALCCDFAEYADIDELAGEYDNNDGVREMLVIIQIDDELADDIRAELLEWFRDQTTVIEIPGTDRIIIQQF